MNRDELDKFIGAVIGKECSINQLLNINFRNNNVLKNDDLLYVLNGLFKASGKEDATLTKETLDKLKRDGMLSEEFYGKIEHSIKDGKIKLEDVLEIETSEELTMEQKKEQAKALESLEKANSPHMTEKDLENLANITNNPNSHVSDDLKAKAKDVIAEKASEAKKHNPELQTNSLTNIENYTNMLRAISPKFTPEPNYVEATTLIEGAIMEGQLSLGAASKILSDVGFNPAEISDLLKSSNTPSPEFNIDDVSASQATAGDRLAETISILDDDQTKLAYEEDPSNSPATNVTPKVTIVRNYINNNQITFEEIKALRESGKLPLNEIEFESIENANTLDTTSADTSSIEEQASDTTMSLSEFLESISLEMDTRYSMENTGMEKLYKPVV